MNGIVSINNQYKQQREERFAEWKTFQQTKTELANRSSLMTTILTEYRKDLQSRNLSTDEMYDKISTAVAEFKQSHSGYLSDYEYQRIIENVMIIMPSEQISTRDRIKLSFLNKFRYQEDDTFGVKQDISNDIKKYHYKTNVNLNAPIILGDNSMMVIEGYYDDLADKLKAVCSDVWFAASL